MLTFIEITTDNKHIRKLKYDKLLPFLNQYLYNYSRKAYGNTNRWFTTIINQPQVQKVIGDFKLCLVKMIGKVT